MSSNNDGSFLDPKTILAIGLVAIIFFGWQLHLKQKYPTYYAEQEAKKEAAHTGKNAQTIAQDPNSPSNSAKTNESVSAKDPNTANVTQTKETAGGTQVAGVVPKEEITVIDNKSIKVEVSSYGLGFKTYHLKDHKDRKNNAIVMGNGIRAPLFATSLISKNPPSKNESGEVGRSDRSEKPIYFKVEKKGENTVIGVAQVGSAVITKTLEFDENLSIWKSSLVVNQLGADYIGLSTLVSEPRVKLDPGSFFAPNVEVQELAFKHEGGLERLSGPIDQKIKEMHYKGAKFVGTGSHYFVAAAIDRSEVFPEARVGYPEDFKSDVFADLVYLPAEKKESFTIKSDYYVGPKSLDKLEAIDKEFNGLINYGFFHTIGKYLHLLLKWFYSHVANWGVAIILLTIVVRIVVLPFNIISYRSMKSMQRIQPLLASVKERYKDDPQAQQRETMAIMKDNKVNPFGGCLPMLLQMPIFFALFQVLGQSVELYQAPFGLWIQDLSVKDQFFVLPVLIGGLMWIQQQLTPTTADPAQAKVLKWMPLLFIFFMVSLPSGLTIYTFVNTLFGVVQQYFFLRETRQKVEPAQALG